MSGARAYLSIGDVLTLLREEFPDVTISKIRFLESQRLVNPERSPSGYRKFYEPDVERLRWVLRQQRDHFLPLKVIRDRLARAGNGVPEDEPPGGRSETADDGPGSGRGEGGAAGEGGGGEATEPGRPAVAARVAAAVSATRVATEGGGNGTTVHVVSPAVPPGGTGGSRTATGTSHGAAPVSPTPPAPPVTGAPATGPEAEGHDGEERDGRPGRSHAERPATQGAATGPAAEASGASAGAGDTPAGDTPAGGATGTGARRPAGTGSRAADAPGAPPGPEGARAGDGGADGDTGREAPGVGGSGVAPLPAHARAEPPEAAASHAPAHAASSGEVPADAASRSQDPPVADAAAPEASVTLDELCATTGLSAAQIASLESFGLIEPVTVAGATYYDKEAVTVATLAADLGRYGIEARHLRIYRTAADREVGLVEQVVAPLLRQRNPAARQRAVDSAHEMARLGEQLRSSLLRRELRRQFGR